MQQTKRLSGIEGGRLIAFWEGGRGRQFQICKRVLAEYFYIPKDTRAIWMTVSTEPFEGSWCVKPGNYGHATILQDGRRANPMYEFLFWLRAVNATANGQYVYVGIEY